MSIIRSDRLLVRFNFLPRPPFVSLGVEKGGTGAGTVILSELDQLASAARGAADKKSDFCFSGRSSLPVVEHYGERSVAWRKIRLLLVREALQ